jgi:hypothetical protein
MATQWASQPWHYVNAVRSWQQRQSGNRELVDIELQMPDMPTMWLFCCVENPIGMVTKRAGIIVPHGPRYYLVCEPTSYSGTSNDGIHWSFSLPLCSCPPGEEQKAALGRLGVTPEIIWHSRLHLLPPCPPAIGEGSGTWGGQASNVTTVSGWMFTAANTPFFGFTAGEIIPQPAASLHWSCDFSASGTLTPESASGQARWHISTCHAGGWDSELAGADQATGPSLPVVANLHAEGTLTPQDSAITMNAGLMAVSGFWQLEPGYSGSIAFAVYQ